MKVTIYIQKDNIERWLALDNKSEWVNLQLAGGESDFDSRVRRIVKEELSNIQSLYS